MRAWSSNPGSKCPRRERTSRANGAGLDVKLSYPTGSFGKAANIKSVKVDLPKQLPSRLTTLQKACPDSGVRRRTRQLVRLRRGWGRRRRLLRYSPTRSAVLRISSVHGGAKFPELVIVLSGDGVTVHLDGETFINKAGITSSTFRSIPDVPVSTFELKLPQGPNSALAANGNLCTSALKMPTAFTAQNGMVIRQSTPVIPLAAPSTRSSTRRRNDMPIREGPLPGTAPKKCTGEWRARRRARACKRDPAWRMLAAMAEVCAERGVSNVTVAHVVSRSGVSRRTFYEMFEDREACFLATLDEAMSVRWRDSAARPIEDAGSDGTSG